MAMPISPVSQFAKLMPKTSPSRPVQTSPRTNDNSAAEAPAKSSGNVGRLINTKA